VLTARGYVTRDPHRQLYTLGIRVWEAGQAYLRDHDLVHECLPVMQAIVDAINETVQLSIRDGIDNVYLAKVDCTHRVRLLSEVGSRLPAHATGLGKVLLADLAHERIDALFAGCALSVFTSHTIADLPALQQELALIRDTGYAVDDQEYTPGLRCVAVPIRGADGTAIAALSASVPLGRASPDQMLPALAAIAGGSLEISQSLGAAGRASSDPILESLARGQIAALRLRHPEHSRVSLRGEEAGAGAGQKQEVATESDVS
jgi:IclR family KDG regulon transcriptional repressor